MTPFFFSVKSLRRSRQLKILATTSLFHFFCSAASVPLCWPDRHSRQHSPAWFRLVHDGEAEGEEGGAGSGGLVETVGGGEAAAWCLCPCLDPSVVSLGAIAA